MGGGGVGGTSLRGTRVWGGGGGGYESRGGGGTRVRVRDWDVRESGLLVSGKSARNTLSITFHNFRLEPQKVNDSIHATYFNLLTLKIQGHVHDYFTHLASSLTNIYIFKVES